MKTKNSETKQKEQAEKIKALRRELETQLEEQLTEEIFSDKPHVEVQKIEAGRVEDPGQAKKVIEALLFASTKPLTLNEIRKVLNGFSAQEIEQWIHEMQEAFASESRSFEIVEIAGGFEMATRRDFAPWILKLELQKKAKQASQSALETLAILAYKQPITRAEIEDLRGVDVSGVLVTLVERAFIKIVGKKEVPGRPFLYATTDKFLEHFGLKSLQELPNIEEIKSVVENAVKKEELLGRTQIVDIPAEESSPNPEPVMDNDNSETLIPTPEEIIENGSESNTQEN